MKFNFIFVDNGYFALYHFNIQNETNEYIAMSKVLLLYFEFQCQLIRNIFFRHIVQNEGPRALFKGLGPNLVGVAPSRAIYFCAYSQTKSALNSLG